MLRYPCLVLDHDDTVVQSETTINYPYFCQTLDIIRPGERITLEEYLLGCYHPGFAQMCRDRYQFTERELYDEYMGWKDHVRTHIPPPYPGIDQIIRRQREAGGLVCVVSHSNRENITRDYETHFGLLPDEIFGWDYPEQQRKPSTYPLETIMEKYQLSPEQLLVVDDLKPGWIMASGAGVPIAFAAWGKAHCPPILQEMTALCDYSFSSTKDLENFLFG